MAGCSVGFYELKETPEDVFLELVWGRERWIGKLVPYDARFVQGCKETECDNYKHLVFQLLKLRKCASKWSSGGKKGSKGMMRHDSCMGGFCKLGSFWGSPKESATLVIGVLKGTRI